MEHKIWNEMMHLRWFGLLVVTLASGALCLTVYPNNAGVIVGQSVDLRCDIQSPLALSWTFAASGLTRSSICDQGCTFVSPPYTSPPYAPTCNGGLCTLTISPVSLGIAGNYACSSTQADTVSGDIIVLGAVQTCSSIQASVVQGNTMYITCSTPYQGRLAPLMKFADANGNTVTGQVINNSAPSQRASYTLVLTASLPEPNISCVLYFGAPSGLGPNDATNTPSFTSTAVCMLPNITECDNCTFCAQNGFITMLVASTVEFPFSFCCAIIFILTLAADNRGSLCSLLGPAIALSITVLVCSAISFIAAAIELAICPYNSPPVSSNCTADYIAYQSMACEIGVLVLNCIVFATAVSVTCNLIYRYHKENEVTVYLQKVFLALGVIATVLSLVTFIWTLVVMDRYRNMCTPSPDQWTWEIWAITEACAITVTVPLTIVYFKCKSRQGSEKIEHATATAQQPQPPSPTQPSSPKRSKHRTGSPASTGKVGVELQPGGTKEPTSAPHYPRRASITPPTGSKKESTPRPLPPARLVPIEQQEDPERKKKKVPTATLR